MRDDFLTIARARQILAEDPSWRGTLLGDLQMHSEWSDGGRSIEDMARHSRDEGHRYAALTDHSKGLPIANGMDEAKLVRQWEEIARTNEVLAEEDPPFRLLRSIEMNLSPEGEGDMDPDVLAGLDLVLGAFHSKLRVKEDQTERYLAAVRNPDVHVLAHPRGRRWGVPRGLHADWPVVFEAAEAAGTALEIDAYPDRQDLQHRLLEQAREAGVSISIGTDAHHPWELAFFELGAAAALRARIPRERILNALSPDQLMAWARG
jgi:histidinol phosphatase-like PHP family hydrolase